MMHNRWAYKYLRRTPLLLGNRKNNERIQIIEETIVNRDRDVRTSIYIMGNSGFWYAISFCRLFFLEG